MELVEACRSQLSHAFLMQPPPIPKYPRFLCLEPQQLQVPFVPPFLPSPLPTTNGESLFCRRHPSRPRTGTIHISPSLRRLAPTTDETTRLLPRMARERMLGAKVKRAGAGQVPIVQPVCLRGARQSKKSLLSGPLFGLFPPRA